ncbi:hypothetical protein ACN4EG_00470 [Alkalinema pantanalense CENA528]|uniref:hypothetical protein n=1 Tax=Alkalinema pantanalense TaxID=1620705 RepID=UPI003D6FE85B
MASVSHVKHYVAYWLQLGKSLVIQSHQRTLKTPLLIIDGEKYSAEFEDSWQQALRHANTSYLESTSQTIAELLTPEWEIVMCARCPMPIALKVAGISNNNCPCQDLNSWPNAETLPPRSPVVSQAVLLDICENLRRNEHHYPRSAPA